MLMVISAPVLAWEVDWNPVSVQLIAEHALIQPGGHTRVGILFNIAEGWHIYAKDPGDAGLPTAITFGGPYGTVFEALVWPIPHVFEDPGGIKTFGYSGTVVLSSTLRYSVFPARSRAPEVIPIKAYVRWLACKEICVPGSAQLELALPISSHPPVPSPQAPLFEQATGS